MIANIDFSQEIFAIDILTALKPSSEHGRKYVLQLLRLYGDQAQAVSGHRKQLWKQKNTT